MLSYYLLRECYRYDNYANYECNWRLRNDQRRLASDWQSRMARSGYYPTLALVRNKKFDLECIDKKNRYIPMWASQ